MKPKFRLRDLLGMKLQLVSNASVMGKPLKAIEEYKQKLLYLKGQSTGQNK